MCERNAIKSTNHYRCSRHVIIFRSAQTGAEVRWADACAVSDDFRASEKVYRRPEEVENRWGSERKRGGKRWTDRREITAEINIRRVTLSVCLPLLPSLCGLLPAAAASQTLASCRQEAAERRV